MPFSTTQAAAFLNFMFSKNSAALTPPTMIYMGLSSNDPEADGGTFTEISGNTYARMLVSRKGETYPDFIGTATGRTIQNVKQVAFNKATAGWLNIKGFGLFTSETGGSPFYYAKVDNEEYPDGIPVAAGSVALFDPGSMKISFATEDV